MEQPDQSKAVKLRPLAGVNERVSSIDVPPADFVEVKGLYPSQVGQLERILGAKFLHQFDEAVLSINHTYNSSGHVLIQTATKRWITTLDELFERNEYTPDLTPTTSEPGHEVLEEETMSMAIVIGKKAAGVGGGTILNVVFSNPTSKRDLSDIVLNEGGIIVSAIASNSFDIAAGTYRIEAWAVCAGNASGSTPTQFVTAMWNDTDDANLFTVGGNVSVATSVLNVSLPVRAINTSENHIMTIIGQMTLTATTSISIRSKAADTHANVVQGKPSNLSTDEVYTMIKILKVA